AAAAGGGGGTRVCGVECGKMATEVGRLRAEMRQASQAVEAARLHATNCSNGEKNAAAESGQLRGRIEQLMNKVTSVERQREQERATSAAAERKAAESAARAAELERELQKERVERREERVKGREKSETVSETQQLLREKETAWERESERLRNDSRTKDAFIMEMQAELVKLRMIAKSAVEAEDLRAELSLLREKTVHLEENLAEENKLKQELFRALRNTQAERDRARQYDYSSSSSFYPLSPTLGSPGSNGTHPPIGSGYTSSDLPSQQQPSLSGLSCAAEQAFAGASKHSYSFASPSTHTSSFLSSGTGQHTLFELPMPPTVGGKVHKNHGFPLVGEELRDNEKEPFYAQNCGKFGAPSPASARTTTTS
ncbi:hypothetical protein PENTCL1PPCAC_24165, partial [Pristionchus entomophagus]